MSTMEKPTQLQHQTHVLFDFSPLDSREDIDDKIQRTYQNLKLMIANKTAKECHEAYVKFIAINVQNNTEELTMGLLVAILVDQDGQQSRYYRDIASFSKDSLNLFSTYLNIIIIDRLSKLKEHSLKQIFWITNQLMKAGITTAENICSNLMRQMAGGDLSVRNVWLIENMLDILIENRSWLINSTSFMIPTVVYTFMRLLADHQLPAQSALRQKEVDFVIGLIREKFWDSMQIGKDFLRLLHNIVKIPEFEKLWHDIFNNPKSLHPTFHNPLQILSTKTPRRLFQSRLTIEMERKISFLATQVRFGNQKRYQDWFHKQYLATPESLSLRCDLIRYICTIIHPSNEVLCSDIIPRWAIIGWLLTTCTSNASATSSRIALFFDWLLYDAKMDNIMNIEPAILVMYYSMRSHPGVTAGLLDFLCRIPTIFAPKLSDHVKAGIKKSCQQILEKRVVPTLVPLFDNPKHDPTLKALLREAFPEFCGHAGPTDNGISHTTNTTTTPVQSNHATTTANHIATTVTKPPIDTTADLEKVTTTTNTLSDAPSVITEPVGNKTLLTKETNHITSKSGDPVVVQSSEDKPEQSGPSSPSPRDEIKAFSWNGTENANASYSHKQNHDNKIRKPSLSNSGTTDAIKKSKAVNNDSGTTETLNNISKNSSVAPVIPEEFTADLAKEDDSPTKVLYPFMTVQNLDFKETLNSFDESLRSILEDLNVERSNEARCSLMDKLISVFFDNSEQSTNSSMVKELGHCLAYLLVDDYSTRIFPSSSQDNELLEESITSPLFVLCRSAFSSSRPNWALRPMCLLAAIYKYLEATGFLVLYFLRVNAIVSGTPGHVAASYIEFNQSAKRKTPKCLHDDLFMLLTYDSEMFCFLLPNVFGDIAASQTFAVTGNIDLIRMVVSAIDPVNLQELICLCLTGNAKVINKEDVLPLIESSLTWESWEQYCLWKLISAQSVPVENYITILPKLDPKANAEAMSCILLNLQKVSEPTVNMLQTVINCECKPNDPHISSILRYWSIKTDIKELAKMISSLFDSRPPSPQVKRKGQTKTTTKNSTTLSSRSEKILFHLESIRQRAPKNKLLAQKEILEMLSQMESLCNENQKKRFSDLFSNRVGTNKKQKKLDKEVTA